MKSLEKTAWRLKPYINEHKDGSVTVGAIDLSGERPYYGPSVHVYADDYSVNLVTCPYEGHVFIHQAALPSLIRVLRKVQKQLREKQHGEK